MMRERARVRAAAKRHDLRDARTTANRRQRACFDAIAFDVFADVLMRHY